MSLNKSEECFEFNSESFTGENEPYVHDHSEFIDIHGGHNQPWVCPSQFSVIPDEQLTDVHTAANNDCSLSSVAQSSCSSISGSHCLQNLKTPVQVSEDNDLVDECSKKFSCRDDKSEDEYLSADEGVEDGKSDGEEIADSDEEYIPQDREGVGPETPHNGNQPACEDGEALLITESDHRCCGEPGPEDSITESDDRCCGEPEPEDSIIDDLQIRKSLEEMLSEEEIQERKEKSQKLKDVGNALFRDGDYEAAIISYTEAVDVCPLHFHKERSIMFANRAACKMKKELYEEAIQDSSLALELHPHYLKALLRRAELYEKTEKLDEALKDYQKVVELDQSQMLARAACVKLAEQIKDRNEKLKEEMIGKLKDLGNLVLRPFGLSVNNFNLQKDPNTGSYSVQFQQNTSRNGS